MNSEIDDCHMKAMKTIFSSSGGKDQEIPRAVQECGWRNSPPLTAAAGKRSQAGRSLKEMTRSGFTPLQKTVTYRNPVSIYFMEKWLDMKKIYCIYKVMNTHLGCEGQTTPKHISPGSEHVLEGVSVVEAVQEWWQCGPLIQKGAQRF